MKNQKYKTRRGLTITEVVVSATLVISMIGLFAPLTVRIGRVWQSTRQFRLALNELANQMERLTLLSPMDCEAALPNLTLSAYVAEALQGSQLVGELIRDEDGTRLKLSLDWDRGANSEPVSIVGWLDSNIAEPSSQDQIIDDDPIETQAVANGSHFVQIEPRALAASTSFAMETVTRLARIIHNPKRKRGIATLPLAYASGCESSLHCLQPDVTSYASLTYIQTELGP